MSTFLKENELYQEFYEKYESDVTKKLFVWLWKNFKEMIIALFYDEYPKRKFEDPENDIDKDSENQFYEYSEIEFHVNSESNFYLEKANKELNILTKAFELEEKEWEFPFKMALKFAFVWKQIYNNIVEYSICCDKCVSLEK